MANVNAETVRKAKKNLGEAFGVDPSGIAFDAMGTDRTSISGLGGAKVSEDSKYDLQRTLAVAVGGGMPQVSIHKDRVQTIIFSNGDLDGTLIALAGMGEGAVSQLKSKIVDMDPAKIKMPPRDY